MLQAKNALIYGAGGSLGGAIAKALAAAGARVFLSGRNIASVERIASEIRSSNGRAEAFKVDGMNEREVNQFVQEVAHDAGSIDISFNAIDYQPVQDVNLVDMSVEDFVRPVRIAMHTQFLTAQAAARVMIKQGTGVILTLTATPGGIGYPLTGGFATACAAIETFATNLAAEVGVHGVRVVNIRSAGSPDSKVFQEAIASAPEVMKDVLHTMKNDTMLKALPQMNDIANVAVFLSSELAGKITGVTIDVTAGTTAALNYRVAKNAT
ncbi:MAG TPA: SDR family oxidoreductase [Chryseosolibacter sp.]